MKLNPNPPKLALAICLLALSAPAQVVVQTVAGGGPNNVLATTASLPNPTAVANDGSGNTYFVLPLSGNNRVFRLTAVGKLELVAGNGRSGFSGDGRPAVEATLNQPSSLAVDRARNVLYIADTVNFRVRAVDLATGLMSTYAGTGVAPSGPVADGVPAASAPINPPRGLALDTAGNLHLTEGNRVRKVDAASQLISTICGGVPGGFAGDGGPAASALLNSPLALAFDGRNSLYISDALNFRIRRVQGGVITTFAGTGVQGNSGDGGPATSATVGATPGLAADSLALYLTSPGSRIRTISFAEGRISHFAGSAIGAAGFAGDGAAAALAQLNSPTGIAYDGSNFTLTIADTANHRLRRVSPSLFISTVAGNGTDIYSPPSLLYAGDGGQATDAILNAPRSIALDEASGALYIGDSANHVIRKLDLLTNVITTFAGTGAIGTGSAGDGGTALSAQLTTPTGLVIETQGRILYFCDVGLHRVRQINLATNVISGFAGNGVPGSAGDGGSASSANLNYPQDLALRTFPESLSPPDLFIADTGNNRVRKVNTGTGQFVISLVAGIGTTGSAGDGGPASAAQLNSPQTIALDGGSLYIGDTLNARIRRVNLTTNVIDTYAGTGSSGDSGDGGPALNAQIGGPTGMAISGGNLYFATDWDNRIRYVSGSTIHAFAGSGVQPGFGGDGLSITQAVFAGPSGIAFDRAGNMWVADRGNNRIRNGTTPVRTLATASYGKFFSIAVGLYTEAGSVGYAARLTEGSLPNGIVLKRSSTRYGTQDYVEGTPLELGSFRFTIRISASAVQSYTMVVSPGQIAIDAPAPGSILPVGSVTFSWQTGLSDGFRLDIGTSPGSGNLCASGLLTPGAGYTAYSCNAIPPNATAYVQLTTRQAGVWAQPLQYTYTTAPAGLSPVLTAPLTTQLASSSTVFAWSPVSGASAYWLDVGTLAHTGNVCASGSITSTSFTCSGIPGLNRAPSGIYVKVWAQVGGVWRFTQYNYVAPPAPTVAPAAFVAPTQGATLPSGSVTFTWSGAIGVDYYWLDVGSTPIQGDLNAGIVNATTKTVANLPTDGRTICVRLWSHQAGGTWLTPQDYTFSAYNDTNPQLVLPGTSGVLPGNTVKFTWRDGSGADGYWLDVGPSPGSGAYSNGFQTTLERTVTGLPCNGSPVYVRLWVLVANVYQKPLDYVFTAATNCLATGPRASITTPAPGTTLPATSVTFTWSPGVGLDYYWLDVGTALGSGNLSNGVVPFTSKIVSGLPANGSTIYVRLWSHVAGGVYLAPIDFTYTAYKPDTRATMLTPIPGGPLPGSAVTFTWKGVGGADGYWLDVGPTGGSGSYSNGFQTGFSRTVTGLPCNSLPIYARLWTRIAGVYQEPIDYAYAAAASCPAIDPRASMVGPAAGSTLIGSSATFTWTAGIGAMQYWLDVGTGPGQNDLFRGVSTAITATVTGLPANGSLIYVRLWSLIGGTWQSANDYVYNSATESRAILSSPTPGTRIIGNTATFTWTAGGAGVDGYWLDVGTALGQGNLSNGLQTTTTKTVTTLPNAGGSATVYVRLWTRIAGVWQTPIDYTFTN